MKMYRLAEMINGSLYPVDDIPKEVIQFGTTGKIGVTQFCRSISFDLLLRKILLNILYFFMYLNAVLFKSRNDLSEFYYLQIIINNSIYLCQKSYFTLYTAMNFL